MPPPGFQALILCGPGVSLNTFTSNPEDFPKALIPIANRPMLWYPLDWCYRMGITKIHIVTPPSSAKAIQAALSQNPHLTSLPAPSADILAPEDLTQTSGTAEILRLPEVQSVITGDFMILPCDIICEIPGESLLEAWMIQQSGLGGVSAGTLDYTGPKMGIGGEKGGRRGGLSVWYQTKTESSVKGEETDFLMTAPLSVPAVPPPEGSLIPHISNLVYSTTTDTLKDICEDKKTFPIRHGLLRKHARVRILTTYRDAHIYLFPHWVLALIAKNPSLDSISEDVVGSWAKAGWQPGLGEKLHLRDIFAPAGKSHERGNGSPHVRSLEEEMDVLGLSTTQTTTLAPSPRSAHRSQGTTPLLSSPLATPPTKHPLTMPPILAYIHPSTPSQPTPLIHRIDTPSLLLSTSLHLATLPPSSPLSHPQKTHPSTTIAARTTISPTSLLAANSTVEEKCTIKDSVIGANCIIKSGARLTRCLLMDGVTVGEKAQLVGCVVGRRAQVGNGCSLRECEVQEGNVVGEGVEARGETFMVFEGLEGGEGEGGDVYGF
ncbi:hypothetical protein MMC30_009210 [Trapelia coarctata]|nr:hypothetical protein [Trapelia coarctata]